MGEILEYCQGLLTDDNLEGVFVQSDLKNSHIKKRRSEIKERNPFLPINNNDENNISQCISPNKLKNVNKAINSEDNYRINTNIIKNGHINGEENDLAKSISKMSHIIESLENKNKILEYEKSEIKNENIKLLQEIEIYKDTISKLRNNVDINDNFENFNKKEKDNGNNNGNTLNENKDEQIKIIFLLENNKSNDDEKNKDTKEEIMAYNYEMFIEVKLRLLNLRHMDPRDIKAYYHNSKEINDWYTLKELNFSDNTIITCKYA